MYARGATPLIRLPSASVFAFPAAIPATWVPWLDCSGSNGFPACGQVAPGGGKARATITFAVVYAACPFGKPAGMVYPAASKNRWVWSTPSSMIPILIPAPAFGRSGSGTSRAWIVAASGPAWTWYLTGANTRMTPGSRERRGRSRVGRTTESPFTTRR
jgi:hypothetical protein